MRWLGRSPQLVRGAMFPWNMSVAPVGRWRSTSLSLAPGAAVATWPDLIGKCGDLTQATGTKQPVFTANVVNGKPAVVFDGSNDFLKLAAFTGGAISQPLAMCLVYKIDGFATTRHVVDGNCSLRMGANSVISAGTDQTGVTPNLNPHRLLAVYNGAHSYLYVDGAANISDKNAGTNTFGGMWLGINHDEASWPFYGWIAEVIVLSGLPSAGDRALLDAYIQQEYGL